MKAQIDFKNGQADVVNAATQLIAMVALDIARTIPQVSLQKIERFNFNIVGAKWCFDDSILSVSIYAGASDGMIEIRGGVFDPDKTASLSDYRDHLIRIISNSVATQFGRQLLWQDKPSGSASQGDVHSPNPTA